VLATAIAATVREWRAYAFAQTANTIARIAGKRAKFTWRKQMTDESTHVAFHLDRDPVLLSAVHCAVQFQASRASLEEKSCAEFAKAAEGVCREALSHLTDADGGLDVTLDTFPDRIEVSIHHHGQLMPPVGLDIFTAPITHENRESNRLSGVQLLSCVDRVSFNAEDGVAHTTLVKFLRPKN
jgi:hypothetical protein